MRKYTNPSSGFQDAAVSAAGPEPRGVRGWVVQALVVLVLATSLAASVSWLASAVGIDWSASVDGWWGAQVSHEGHLGPLKGQQGLTSRDLLISIKGDELTAVYTATAPAKSALAVEALTRGNSNVDSDLISHDLGYISIAEFHYGLTGSHYNWVPLTFHGPQVTVGRKKTKVTVASDPLRLLLNHPHIRVAEPAGVKVNGMDRIRVQAADVQVITVSGAQLTRIAKDKVSLDRDDALAKMTIYADTSSGQAWLTGLRSIGGTTAPVADGFLWRMAGLFDYAVLLWALAVRKPTPDSRVIAVARNSVFMVLVALAAVAVLAFMLDLGSVLFQVKNQRGEAAAGPLGLLVAGIVLVWPAACSRVGSANRARRNRPGSARPVITIFTVVAHAVVLVGYGLALYAAIGTDPLTNVHALAATAAVVVLVPLLIRRLLGTASMMPGLVSAGTLGITLGATIVWPVLYFNGWTPVWDTVAHVNVLGKWAFLALGAFTAFGLCLMTFRFTQALEYKTRWRWLWTAAIAAVIGVAVLHDAITNAHLADSHTTGSTVVDLFGLFDALPQLLDWLLLALAIAVAMSLPATSDWRQLGRRLAIPIGLLLLYSNSGWFYVPVTLIIGLIMLDRLVFPKRLAELPPSECKPAQALKGSLAAWRRAEFADEQRQALVANSGDALRDLLVQKDEPSYTKSMESLAKAQSDLAEERDRWQSNARKAKAQAFDHWGNPPDKRTAVAGAVVGAVLGIIPASITLLTTPPSLDSSGYPVLGFFGGTAWSLFLWSALGWFVGYFLPFMRGRSGSEKALWLFTASIGAILPMSVIWNDGSDWNLFLIWSLELFVFLMIAAVYLCDLRTLSAASMRTIDWIPVQNWRFVIGWSTALLAAIGAALVTFLSTAVTDLGHQTFVGIFGPSSVTATQNTPNPNNSSPR